ncbi:MAG: hypothetical protein U0326_21590 [Polyangiales bacterium]
MSEQVNPEPSKGPRGQRARRLALPRWFASRDASTAPAPGADRPLGESLPVVFALVFCALGVCFTVLAIRRITAAGLPPAPQHRALAPADPTSELRGARS